MSERVCVCYMRMYGRSVHLAYVDHRYYGKLLNHFKNKLSIIIDLARFCNAMVAKKKKQINIDG